MVTSDRDIASNAWTSGAVPISSEDFMNAIEKRQTEKEVLYEDDYEEYGKSDRKGNPKQMSKKEKAIRRMLSKL